MKLGDIYAIRDSGMLVYVQLSRYIVKNQWKFYACRVISTPPYTFSVSLDELKESSSAGWFLVFPQIFRKDKRSTFVGNDKVSVEGMPTYKLFADEGIVIITGSERIVLPYSADETQEKIYKSAIPATVFSPLDEALRLASQSMNLRYEPTARVEIVSEPSTRHFVEFTDPNDAESFADEVRQAGFEAAVGNCIVDEEAIAFEVTATIPQATLNTADAIDMIERCAAKHNGEISGREIDLG